MRSIGDGVRTAARDKSPGSGMSPAISPTTNAPPGHNFRVLFGISSPLSACATTSHPMRPNVVPKRANGTSEARVAPYGSIVAL